MANKIISNKPYTFKEYFDKIRKSRYLIKTLILREFKVKYSRTFIGLGWVFIQPIVVVAIYTIFFKNFIHLDTQDIPYPHFVLSGLALWYLFTGVVSKATYSLLESADLIHKISFPKIIAIISKTVPVILECLVLLILAFLVVLFTTGAVGFNAVTIIFYFIEILLFSVSIGMICSILSLKYRDLAHAIPFLINFGIWLTPVFYPVTVIPPGLYPFFKFGNPLVLAIEGLRGALFRNAGISMESLILFACTCLLFTFSFLIFVKFEKRITETL